jgi:hypothetical protein
MVFKNRPLLEQSYALITVPEKYNEITPWSRVFPEKLTGSQLVKNFPHFMEIEGSLPHSQGPTTGGLVT